MSRVIQPYPNPSKSLLEREASRGGILGNFVNWLKEQNLSGNGPHTVETDMQDIYGMFDASGKDDFNAKLADFRKRGPIGIDFRSGSSNRLR